MIELLGWDLGNHRRLWQGGYVATRGGTDGLVQARNNTVEEFLEQRPDADWLFWIDTDMGFPAYTVDALLAAADPVERPVVGCLAFSQRELSPDGLGGWRTSPGPTVFDWTQVDDKAGFAVRWDYSRDVVTKAEGTGAACVLIHRSVFERVREEFGDNWYTRITNKTMGQLTSEDLSFCMRLGKLGIPIFVHTGVKTTHMKRVWISEEDFDAARAPIPAAEQAAVVVPVLRRPQNAARFMASLRASTGMATVYAVADEGDEETIAAWESTGAVVIHTQPGPFGVGTFAEKCNLAYRETDEPWLFVVGDDVRFWPGWLDRAQETAGDKLHVIGTNDLANSRVTTGEHATHLLIRRSYVDEMGASWDGPGVVAHEGYRHWFTDDEIVTAAKARGVWSPCLLAKVEHLHPMVAKAELDDTYRLGASMQDADRELFEKRQAEFL